MNFFCSSLCKDLSDNLTEMPIMKNSIDMCDCCTVTCARARCNNNTLGSKEPQNGSDILSDI